MLIIAIDALFTFFSLFRGLICDWHFLVTLIWFVIAGLFHCVLHKGLAELAPYLHRELARFESEPLLTRVVSQECQARSKIKWKMKCPG